MTKWDLIFFGKWIIPIHNVIISSNPINMLLSNKICYQQHPSTALIISQVHNSHPLPVGLERFRNPFQFYQNLPWFRNGLALFHYGLSLWMLFPFYHLLVYHLFGVHFHSVNTIHIEMIVLFTHVYKGYEPRDHNMHPLPHPHSCRVWVHIFRIDGAVLRFWFWLL